MDKKLNLRAYLLIHILILLLISFLVYFLSFESRVKILSCSGNYYFTDQQIYQIANIDMSTRSMFASTSSMEKRLLDNPLIEKVEIKKNKDKVSFQIVEKVIIGYYIKDGKYYLVCNDESKIKLDDQYKNNLIHLPFITGFSDTQINKICREFRKYDKYLNRGLIEKIAEVVPYKTSYDPSMLKITMQDGNFVFSRIEDILMMARYEQMLEGLKGNSVCLVLDADNSVITKIDCEYMNMSQKDREKYHDEEDRARKEYEEQLKKQQEEQAKAEQEQAKKPSKKEIEEAEDWELTGFGYEYSETLNLYRDPSTGDIYIWDDTLGLQKQE